MNTTTDPRQIFLNMCYQVACDAEGITRAASLCGVGTRVYLWHGPAHIGGLVASETQPEGYTLVTPECFPRHRAYDSWPAWVASVASRSPVFPTEGVPA